MAKCDQNLDPYESALVDPYSDLYPLWGKKLDPDPLWNLCGSETLSFQKVVISILILDFFDFYIPFYLRSGSKSGTGMYNDSSSAEASTIVAVPVPQHWFLFQYLLAQAVVPFCRPCTIIFLIVFALKTPSDSQLPSFAPKDFILSLFFVR